MKINRDHVKSVASFVTVASVNAVVKTVIAQNCAPKNTLHKVELFVGAYTLGSLLAKPVTAHTNERVDEAAEFLSNFKTKTQP